MLIEVENQYRIKIARGQIEFAAVGANLIAVAKVAITPGAEVLEVGTVGRQAVARYGVDNIAVERDAANRRPGVVDCQFFLYFLLFKVQ